VKGQNDSPSETVEIRGHIIDSFVLPKIFDDVVELGGEFKVLDFNIGRTHDEQSYARIQVSTPDQGSLEELLRRLHRHGAVPVETGEAALVAADMDGAFPENFYSTTNLPTDVRVGGKWIPVENPEMDCGIIVDDERALTIPMSDIRKGQQIVTGRAGIKVRPLDRPRGQGAFEFMASDISSEKPKQLQVERVADQLRETRAAGTKILWVVGPALIHSGSGQDLARLVESGWVDVLFAGNGFATHDIESYMFGTSLGINLYEGAPVEAGHEHHIRAINAVRRAGGIKEAVERGLISGGVMFNLVKRNIPYVLGGSVRDDGPLPDTIADVVEAQRQMRAQASGVGLAIMVASMLHGIATGNILPAATQIVCVDINPATVTKLMDRGSLQSLGLVTDVGLFIKELAGLLIKA
jgi:lysine-ketoglutarate reductase/saccharopine dehydrogenase-like protein (TIGR00300 family)